jgi:thioredoxin-dependent peroxiredoxin
LILVLLFSKLKKMKKFTIILALLTLTISVMAQNVNELKIGDKVSEFSGIDDTGANWKSSTLKSDFLVVYFYPAAMTGGCTAQACAYRDDKATFDKLGATIVGISGDEVKNLKVFKESSQLNFPLISDSKGAISKTFGVPTKEGGSITREIAGENFLLVRGITVSRWTFVLDKNRKIIYKNAEVNAAEDSKKVMEVIKNYKK